MKTKYSVLKPEPEVFTFLEMDVGDAFSYNGKVYLKIENQGDCNAVVLAGDMAVGQVAEIDNDSIVVPAKEVIVKM